MKRILCSICWPALLAILIAPVESGAQGTTSYHAEEARSRSIHQQQLPSQNPKYDSETAKLMHIQPHYLSWNGMDADSWDHVSATIERTQVYQLTRLDSLQTGKAIAWHIVKRSIQNELADIITGRAGNQLLTSCGDIQVILPSAIPVEQTGEEWEEGRLKLTARTTYVLSRIMPIIAGSCSNPEVVREISNERSMADAAMNELLQIQREVAESNEGASVSQHYLNAVNHLIAADKLERGRYHALWGQAEQAIDVYSQAIEKSPELTAAYRNRGALYISTSDKPRALRDIETAAQLGDKRAQDYLNSKGIKWHLN